jgi:prepilin-type N-terminal cleavage/methylation domain-containing protein
MPVFCLKDDDRGFGMTELAVAILVLGIVLIGLFPLVINSVGLVQSNSEVGRANLIVSAQIDQARAELAALSCASVSPSNASQPLTLGEQEAEKFGAVREIIACDNRLATVEVRVWRTDQLNEGALEGPTISSAVTKTVTAS